jgi:hypothetical protein
MEISMQWKGNLICTGIKQKLQTKKYDYQAT